MENDGSCQVPERFGVVLVVVLESEEELLNLALLMMVLLLGIVSSFRWEKGQCTPAERRFPFILIHYSRR